MRPSIEPRDKSLLSSTDMRNKSRLITRRLRWRKSRQLTRSKAPSGTREGKRKLRYAMKASESHRSVSGDSGKEEFRFAKRPLSSSSGHARTHT